MASALLEGRKQLHQLVGRSSGRIARFLGADRTAQAFVGEVAANISLRAIDAKAVAVARSIQTSGVLLCTLRGISMTQCQCFRDLALAESQEQVREILAGAMGNWADLQRFRPEHRLAW
jgi:hypothetical protein